MDKLNYECLEHIFRFINCGPKEWLVLSQVCLKWQYVIARFWKRIDCVEIANIRVRNREFLSTKRVIGIMEHAGQYVNEITITARKINNIRLGKYSYNLNGLDVDAVLEVIQSKCSGNILKASFFPDNRMFDCIMKPNPNIKKLGLTLDKQHSSWNFVGETQVEELELTWHRICKVPCELVVQSFPGLKKLTVILLMTKRTLSAVDILFTSLSDRPALEELHVQVSKLAKPETLGLNGSKDMMKTTQNIRVLQIEGIGADFCLENILMSLPNLEKLSVEISFCIRLRDDSLNERQTFDKLTMLAIRFRNSYDIFTQFSGTSNEVSSLIDKMPSLLELKLDTSHLASDDFDSSDDSDYADNFRSGSYFNNVEKSKAIISHAVNLAISLKKRVIINNFFEIIEKFTNAEHAETKTLAISIPFKEGFTMLRLFLENTFKNCKITAIL